MHARVCFWLCLSGYVFRDGGYSSLQPPFIGSGADQAGVDARVDRLMDEAGGEVIDYGAGAEDYVRGGVAQQAAVDANMNRLMDVAGGEAIDYGTGAEEYIRGGGGGGGDLSSGGSENVDRERSSDQTLTLAEFLPRPADYLQAFSHFSYHHSQRKMLVCDLQGVMSQHSPGSSCAGVFELTGECTAPVL